MHSIFDFKTMDLRSYFSKATSASRLSSNSSEDESEVESSELEVSPPKKHCGTEYTHHCEETCKVSFHNKQQEIQCEIGKRFYLA